MVPHEDAGEGSISGCSGARLIGLGSGSDAMLSPRGSLVVLIGAVRPLRLVPEGAERRPIAPRDAFEVDADAAMVRSDEPGLLKRVDTALDEAGRASYCP